MTCFWDGIIKALSDADKEKLGFGVDEKVTPLKLLQQLKALNTTPKCKWQGFFLGDKQSEEHFEDVKNYDVSVLSCGHLTAACDSFLLLVCTLLNVKIVHDFAGHELVYESGDPPLRSTWNFRSARTHFQFVSKKDTPCGEIFS